MVIPVSKPLHTNSTEPVILFGGTFDPIHLGHLRAAVEIRERIGAKTLWLLPCHLPGHRDLPGTSTQHRINMIKLAIQGDHHTEATNLKIDSRECECQQTSYTVNTLLSIRKEIGETTPLILCLGMDSFNSLEQWYRWEQLLELTHLLVVQRPGTQTTQSATLQALLEKHLQSDRNTLSQTAAGSIWIENITPLAISATAIRDQIKRGFSARYLVPDKVWHYIKQKHLYNYT